MACPVKVAIPASFVVVLFVPVRFPPGFAERLALTVMPEVVTLLLQASCSRAEAFVLKVAFAMAVAGGCVETASFVALPGVSCTEFEVAAVRPVALKVSV